MKMNPEVKAKWLAKLRDPETEQARMCLAKPHSTDSAKVAVCVWGALCEVAREAGILKREEDHHQDFYWYFSDPDKDDADTCAPPVAALLWAGFRNERMPDLVFHGAKYGLAGLNDAVALSLPEMADLIEKQL